MLKSRAVKHWYWLASPGLQSTSPRFTHLASSTKSSVFLAHFYEYYGTSRQLIMTFWSTSIQNWHHNHQWTGLATWPAFCRIPKQPWFSTLIGNQKTKRKQTKPSLSINRLRISWSAKDDKGKTQMTDNLDFSSQNQN